MPKLPLADDFPDQTVKKPAGAADGDGGLWHGEQAVLQTLRLVKLVGVTILLAVTPLYGFSALTVLMAWFVAVVGVIHALIAYGQSLWNPKPLPGGFMLRVAVVTVINACMALFGMLIAFTATMGFSRGRQLRRFGKVLLPDVQPGGDWATLPMDATVDDAVRAGLAEQWRENGRTEHASVGAFARLTLDLMALGAPPKLVADSNRDSLDEIRHTELCFSLARDLDGKAESPGPFPAAAGARTLVPGRTLSLASLAVDSLIDGALHEGVSARVIARLAKVCEEPRIREVLKEIAADEGRHAAHGWDVVAWCLAEGKEAVAAALTGALRTIPREMHGAIPAAAEDGAWERFGIHGRAMEADEYVKARADIVTRVERMVAEQVALAA